MTYTHLTTDELVMIESYYHQNIKVSEIAAYLKRSRTPIYNVIHFLKEGHTALEYYQQYKRNKKRCGRRKIVLPAEQQTYIKEKIAQGWTPDIIKGREEMPIDCSMRTLYRRFKEKVFDETTLPMKGKRKPNGHQERRGKQAFKRNIAERKVDYPTFKEEFGHIEGDTIVGAHHKSAVITLVERLSKVIITLKPEGRKANDIEKTMNQWFESIPRHLFKSITFDCGKEFSNWKALSNQQDIAIYFADPGTPSQRALNENSNGLLRRDGLPKEMDFNQVDQAFVSSVANKRNNIPRKSLAYRTPLEVFLSYLDESILSSLN
ncbi:IS30 family transposase [Jeotgalibaca sp. MA1X17-3]|uniref:IS30 family transposase n=1 Tax=Jeotgalibaca sp. MA1X17-3 TaxID=2908211 RepID=UPI001F1C42AE|nr:IS30 family transposase [Jeotgalibaca sp. MA1X17-3]UJF14693.1 IS30 family transposase [Jeotgalibaca sp. MA1X17-3]UJF15282.1 IS30 family transposase [Jeotgalibaca sp. MA1X17-3]UJF16595.1 IS30 family transposase [Jeotgalibaca sp. MA1X17-3]